MQIASPWNNLTCPLPSYVFPLVDSRGLIRFKFSVSLECCIRQSFVSSIRMLMMSDLLFFHCLLKQFNILMCTMNHPERKDTVFHIPQTYLR